MDQTDLDYRGGYDAAGNVLRYHLADYVNGAGNDYRRTLTRFESYREVRVDATSTKMQPGATTSRLDASGNLLAIEDATKGENSRRFVNDLAGRALYEIQGGNVQRQLIVNGEVLGRFGVGLSEVKPKDDAGNPNFAALAEFGFGYRPISGSYPSGLAGSVTVGPGDTLRSVARSVWGDEQLWYRLAEANGLAGEAVRRRRQVRSQTLR